MLTTEGIAQELGDPSAINGWDAVFAMNLEQVNALFFQEYLDIGPTNTRAETFLRCALSDDSSSMLILDATLGPPALSVQDQGAGASVAMELMSGVLVTLDVDTLDFISAALIRPNESKLTGSLELAKVQGEIDQLGAVVMDLGATAYSPTVSGIDPGSVLNTRIGDAARTYFRDNAAKYTIGIIGSIQVAKSLTPRSFSVTTQKHPTKPDSCVLLLITTNGQPGTVAPLATYPIPDDARVALLVSQPALFGALCEDLGHTFGQFGTTFSPRDNAGVASAVGAGGAIGSGPFGKEYDTSQWNQYYYDGRPPWTSDGNGHLALVQMPLTGFTVVATNGQLAASWSSQFTPNVSGLVHNTIGMDFVVVSTNASTLQVEYSCAGGAPTVDPGSSKVSFAFSAPTVSVKIVAEPSGWNSFWAGARTYNDAMIDAARTNLVKTLKGFTVASIDAFRLKSILFQSPHVVQMTKAALPNGVLLTGNAVSPIHISPGSSTVEPGQTVQFTATAPANATVMWQLKPAVGSLDRNTGVYSAPASITAAQVVVVTAVDTADTTVRGSAMVLVTETPAARGVAVRPAVSLVAPGHATELSTTDGAGTPASVTWTLTPSIGTIRQGRKQGEYAYVAPSQISEATPVTLTAVDAANSALVGSATVRVMPPSTVHVAPAQAPVAYGATLALTATVGEGDTDHLRWVVYPVGSGSVIPNNEDPTKAAYTAPAKAVPGGNLVTVLAYLVDDDNAGSGSATINLPAT